MRILIKKNISLILVVITLYAIGCGNLDEHGIDLENPFLEDSSISTEHKETRKVEIIPENPYVNSLLPEEMMYIEGLVKEFYETSFPYDFVSMEVANETDLIYEHYKEYEPGNIIAFNVKTTYERGEDFRKIVFGRDDKESKWERLKKHGETGRVIIIEAPPYAASLSPEEMMHVEGLVKEFYETSFPYDLVSMEVAGDRDFFYRHYKEYEPGNIIVFLIRTEYEKDGFLLRRIVFGRDDRESEWERLNEGY